METLEGTADDHETRISTAENDINGNSFLFFFFVSVNWEDDGRQFIGFVLYLKIKDFESFEILIL